MNNLPQGWSEACLLELTGINGLMTDGDWVESKDQDPGGEVRLIQLADIGDQVFINKSRRFLTLSRAKELNCTFLKEGDLLIARMPDPLGRACLFPYINQASVTVVDICIWRSGKYSAHSKWLMYTINSPSIRNKIQSLASGTTRQRVSGGNLKQLSLPVPPLGEQGRIVEKLDELLGRSRRAREELQHIPKLIQRYKQAVLAAAFRGDLTADWRKDNFYEWSNQDAMIFRQDSLLRRKVLRGSRLAIGQLVSEEEILNFLPRAWLYGRLIDITNIKTGFAFKSKDFQKMGVKLLRGINISPNKIDWTDAVCLQPELASSYEEYQIEVGDLLLAMDRPVISSGLKFAQATADDLPSLLVQRVARIRSTKWTIMSFLKYLLNSHIFVNHAMAHATGSDLPHISSNDIALTPVPIPPLEEQKEIVRRIEERFKAIEAIEQNYQKAIQLLDRLDQATLAKAFRGQLVPQDPNDEPASVLLERIRAQRASQPPARKRKPKTS